MTTYETLSVALSFAKVIAVAFAGYAFLRRIILLEKEVEELKKNGRK